MIGYPRDLVGYADQPQDPRWPGGARLALNFVVNYEEGGERSVLHGDKVAETRLTDLLTPAPLQGARDFNMESAYEYGSRVGFWRLMRVFAERQVIPTIYAVGMALERNMSGPRGSRMGIPPLLVASLACCGRRIGLPMTSCCANAEA